MTRKEGWPRPLKKREGCRGFRQALALGGLEVVDEFVHGVEEGGGLVGDLVGGFPCGGEAVAALGEGGGGEVVGEECFKVAKVAE